jgi:hypothetical protein
MKRLLIGLALAALAVPAGAAAGGWATVGVSPPNDGTGAGDTWNAKVTVLQHGNPETPLMGVTPTLTIKNGSTTKTFEGSSTNEQGVSTIKVVFPSAGQWSYEVYDGFTMYGGAQTHTFAPVSVGPGGGGDGFPTLTLTWVLLAAMGIGFVLWLLSRRMRVRAPAPSH